MVPDCDATRHVANLAPACGPRGSESALSGLGRAL